ncbi:MAG: hypothetical protein K8F52_14405 [Candidatus Scalindua rubra]|uniref:Transposase IS200-like domain-containing protein n=1 Tax=Candidatus Scalindua brodae TaxID=237368 RepID=A0A0B0EMW7_9BACT|nr:MAG: hypothetical protein SCABRO_01747 [Candidatus Scalindua brodae]MBZ0109841.1 hypothetical protein [Candidatus Scalindua rubra]
MARIARIVVEEEEAVYHVMSRTALDGFVLGDGEKDELLKIIKRLSAVYFTEVLGFCIMGNHFHLAVRVRPGGEYTDVEVRKRFKLYYGKDSKRELAEDQISIIRSKWGNLSEYVKEIKQNFSRYYNRKVGRKGFFWSDRFKSVLVENGETLINCLAYIDLNPVRAGIVKRPEDYRWCSLGYHVQAGNKDKFLSLDFGLSDFVRATAKKRFEYYREFVYEKGGIETSAGRQIDPEILERERQKRYKIGKTDRFVYRTRYFTDSAIIGSKGFVSMYYHKFKDHFQSVHDKVPRIISGIEGVYSLKRLSEL